MLSLSLPERSWAHHCPAGAKLLGLFGAMSLVLTLKGTAAMGGAAAAVALLYFTLGPSLLRPALRPLAMLLPVVAVVLLYHLLTGREQVGIATALRILTMVSLANFVTMTTRLDEMTAIVERLARPLRIAGLEPRRLSLMMAIFLRFLPVIRARHGALSEAWLARSARRHGARVVAALTIATIDDAERLADALVARGGAVSARTGPQRKDTHGS